MKQDGRNLELDILDPNTNNWTDQFTREFNRFCSLRERQEVKKEADEHFPSQSSDC